MARRLPQLMIASRLEQELDHLLSALLELAGPSLPSSDWQPRADILESPAGLHVVVELPGVEAADLEVVLEGEELKISGRKPPSRAIARARYHCLERGHGTFSRQLRLPRPVDNQRASARLTSGLLILSLPRIEERRHRAYHLTVRDEQDGADE
jgi:HSP20 family protein